MKISKAVIPAAGLGTRFLPATKALPKEMLPLVDKPTIQFVIEEAVMAGIEDILIITGRNKRAIEDHFDRSIELELLLKEKGKDDDLRLIKDISNLANIFYIRQKEPLGLGHAVYCARKFIGDEPFAVLLGDDVMAADKPVIGQLIDVYSDKQASVLGVKNVGYDNVHKYGVVDTDQSGENPVRVKTLTEKPTKDLASSDLAVLGRYIIKPEIFSILEHTRPGAGGEIQLTDALNVLAGNQPVWAYTFTGRRYDVGDRLGFLQATIEFALQRDSLKDEFKAYLMSLLPTLDRK